MMTELERSVLLVGASPYESSGIDSLTADHYQYRHQSNQSARANYCSSSSASSPLSTSSMSSQLLYCSRIRPNCASVMPSCGRPSVGQQCAPIDLSPSTLSARSVYQCGGTTAYSMAKPISPSCPFDGSFQLDSNGRSTSAVCVPGDISARIESPLRPLTDYSPPKLNASPSSPVSRVHNCYNNGTSKYSPPIYDPMLQTLTKSTEMCTDFNENKTNMSRLLDRIDGSSSMVASSHSPNVTSLSARTDMGIHTRLEPSARALPVAQPTLYPNCGHHRHLAHHPPQHQPQHYPHPSRYYVQHQQVVSVSAGPASLPPPAPVLASSASPTAPTANNSNNNGNNGNSVALSCSSSSSPLRSSRSFTASHRQRPNVTLIRRKSASERLAESKCRYIRSPTAACRNVTDTEENNFNFDYIETRPDNNYLVSSCCLSVDDQADPSSSTLLGHSAATMKLLRETPTSTKSSQTSSSLSSPCLRFSPIQDGLPNGQNGSTQYDDRYANHNHNNNNHHGHHNLMHTNLVDKINNQLNRPKQFNISPNNGFNNPKKRVSPKLSESSNSNGTSNLEIQLRELIGMDAGNESGSNEQANADQVDNVVAVQPKPIQSPNKIEKEILAQKEREANNIYRAELKYIGSSSSSLSTDYSEQHPSLSPIEPIHPKSNQANFFNDSSDGILKCPLAPSITEKSNIAVVRSKSDVSVKNQVMIEKYKSDTREQVDRLFQSLGLDSDSTYRSSQDRPNRPQVLQNPTSQSSNLRNQYTASSCSNDSLEKLNRLKKTQTGQISKIRVDNQSNPSTPKSSSTNDLLSINSLSQLSVSKSFSRNQLNHSKSTSKLTFQNLMIHQQSLTPSRSCHNLIANFQTGPSVVERNARIIKWLFNCRKAMNQMDTSISTFN